MNAPNDARIEAAAYVLCRRGALSRAPYDIAVDMLAAADESEAPLVERLAEALRELQDEVLTWLVYEQKQPHDPYRPLVEVGLAQTRAALAAFDARRADQ